MKIYTKTGDGGETGLLGGGRVAKDNPRIEAFGTVDELNALVGTSRTLNGDPEIEEVLSAVQRDLFVLGSDLATPRKGAKARPPRIEGKQVQRLESTIDRLEAKLEPLTAFVLPGGSAAGSQLHVARTVCRRAERQVVALAHGEDLGEFVIPYLNRLSDLLFVLSRYANSRAGKREELWTPGAGT